MMNSVSAEHVLRFWFEELTPSHWFAKSKEIDQICEKRFGTLHKSASKGELFSWRSHPEGRLAEIIVLDQFSRNIYRNHPESFENDPLALVLAQEMVLRGLDRELTIHERAFVYMPYMHSESRLIHDEALKLFSAQGLEESLIYEIAHKKIIDTFGRYPHRNAILNRLSTMKELEFLQNNKEF